MRSLLKPHMLIHAVMAAAGVALLLSGSAIGLFLLVCAVMMGVLMGGYGSHGSDGSDERPSGESRHH